MIFRQTKHIILLILLTGLVLFLTKGFWLVAQKGVFVSFISQAKNPINYQVFYTSSENRPFNSQEKITQNVPAGKQNVKIMIPADKVLRFRLDLGQFPQEVTISDLKVMGKQTFTLDKLSDFILHQIDTSRQQENAFQFFSNQPDPYIIYKSPLNLSAKWQLKIDYYILFIIAVIGLLAAHKIVLYLAQFKFKESTSRLDIVFVTVFFILLFVPMLHISEADRSEKENRMLAHYVPFIKEGQINLKYSTNFESWYNDRFFGRDFLINLYSFLEQKLNPNRGNKNVLIGKDGWLFTQKWNSVNMYRHANLFTKEELATIGKNISQFVTEAHKRGIKEVYFYLSNDKESLYGEYYPNWIQQLKSPSRLEQLHNFLKENYPDIKVFNFAKELQGVKKQGEVLFFKAGTHMNPLGAFYEYHFLMENIQKDFPDLNPLTLKDFVIRTEVFDDKDLYRGLNLSSTTYSDKNLQNKRLYLTTPTAPTVQEKRDNSYIHITSNNSKPRNNYYLMTINDSFLERHRPYLQPTFKKMDMNFFGDGMNFQMPSHECKYINKNKPDLLIVAMTERFLDRFLTLRYPCSKN